MPTTRQMTKRMAAGEWEVLLPRSAGRKGALVSIAVTDTNVLVHLDPTISSQLGWRSREKVLIRIGRGDNANKMQLIPDERGYVTGGQGRNGRVRVAIKAWKGAPARCFATPVYFTVSGRVLEIELPEAKVRQTAKSA